MTNSCVISPSYPHESCTGMHSSYPAVKPELLNWSSWCHAEQLMTPWCKTTHHLDAMQDTWSSSCSTMHDENIADSPNLPKLGDMERWWHWSIFHICPGVGWRWLEWHLVTSFTFFQQTEITFIKICLWSILEPEWRKVTMGLDQVLPVDWWHCHCDKEKRLWTLKNWIQTSVNRWQHCSKTE